MTTPKRGTPNLPGPAVRIATVGIVLNKRDHRDAVVAAFLETRDLIAVDLGDGGSDTVPRATHLSPDVILLDLPDESLRGLVEQLSLTVPRTCLIAVNRLETDDELISLFEAGITAFIPWGAAAEETFATVRDVLRGEFRCPPRIVVALTHRLHAATRGQAHTSGRTSLTPRQTQIVHLLQQGLTNKEIAARLGIAFSTVKNHVHRLLKKLAIERRQQAVRRTMPTSPRRGAIEVASPEPGRRR